ncbi:MAG: hypothetical protein SGILL_003443 [Bacillariaceae sp.]
MFMTTLQKTTLLLLVALLCVAHGFVGKTVDPSMTKRRESTSSASTSHTTTTSLNVIPPEIAVEVQDARNQALFWFFGASGGAGIARQSFPRMYKNIRYIQGLKNNCEPTLGGETIGLSPLCGYPQDIAIKDVEKVVSNPLSIEQIVEQFPVEGSFMVSKGYLAFSAFERANADANPAAVRAIFDTFSQSTDLSDPRQAQANMDMFKEDPKSLNGALLKSKLNSFSAVFGLLFLLGLADVVAFGHAKDGWFYGWTLEDGIQNIPNFWI